MQENQIFIKYFNTKRRSLVYDTILIKILWNFIEIPLQNNRFLNFSQNPVWKQTLTMMLVQLLSVAPRFLFSSIGTLLEHIGFAWETESGSTVGEPEEREKILHSKGGFNDCWIGGVAVRRRGAT